jgi:hypothetical protein
MTYGIFGGTQNSPPELRQVREVPSVQRQMTPAEQEQAALTQAQRQHRARLAVEAARARGNYVQHTPTNLDGPNSARMANFLAREREIAAAKAELAAAERQRMGIPQPRPVDPLRTKRARGSWPFPMPTHIAYFGGLDRAVLADFGIPQRVGVSPQTLFSALLELERMGEVTLFAVPGPDGNGVVCRARPALPSEWAEVEMARQRGAAA